MTGKLYNNCRVHQSFGFTNLHAAKTAAQFTGYSDYDELLSMELDKMLLMMPGCRAAVARRQN